MSLPAYPRYKPSGVEWLGQIPQHWESAPLKRFASLVTEKGDGSRRQLGLEHVASWTGEFIESSSDFSSNGTKFREDDILFGKLRPYLAKVGLANFEGEAVGDFHVIRSTDIEPHFLQLQMLTDWFINIVDGSTYGAKMPRASWDFVGGVSIAVPPRHEQVAIGCFLDRETAKIDALIEEQEKLISLLQEKRQAVISHAVTKGLDPDAPMKPSNIDWLGDIPAHWSSASMKHLAVEITDGAHVSPDTENGEYDFVSTVDVKAGVIDFSACLKTSAESYQYLVKTGCRPNPGDVLFSKDGTVGRTAVVRDAHEFVVASSLIIIRLDNELTDSDFVDYLCQSDAIQGQVDSYVKGAGLPRISIKNVKRIRICFPPLEEQRKIAGHLLPICTEIQQLIDTARKSAELLKERRAALISAAVTGKIDVRGLAAHSEKQVEEVAA